MNASDQHREPEVAELARLLPVPAERDLAADRHLLLREHLMTQVQVAQPGFGAFRWPRAGRGAIALAAGLVVLAITVSATALGTLARSGGTVSPGGPSVYSTGPSALLNKIAAAAARVHQHPPGRNQYTYVRSYSSAAGAKLEEEKVWTPVSNLCLGITTVQDGQTSVEAVGGVHCPYAGKIRQAATYRLLASLPTRPAALRAAILAGLKPDRHPNQWVMFVASRVLIDDIAPAKVTAALYRVMARLPRLRVVTHAVDPRGRVGVGVRFTVGAYGIELIFNSKTLRLLGDKATYNGRIDSQTAVVAKAFVNKAG